MKKWLPILVLGLTQFVMVLDGTVMNVSITEVVGDLGTTTSNMQLAIATFTLTMAAFMLWTRPRWLLKLRHVRRTARPYQKRGPSCLNPS